MKTESTFTLEDVPMLSGVLARAIQEIATIQEELSNVKHNNHANSKFVKLGRRLDYEKQTIREVSQDIEEILSLKIGGYN